MKVFQAIHKYNPYIPHFESRYDVSSMSFDEHLKALINDRFYASHILKPMLDFSKDAFYTIWDYDVLQLKWAKEKGWNETDLKKILYAQIEDFKPDVFYTTASDDYGAKELDTNIDDKIIRICWSAAPGRNEENYKPYHARLTNFPLDIRPYDEVGYRNFLFQPAHDPVMDSFAQNEDRPIDVFFYGQYERLAFKRRNKQLDELLKFKEKSNLNIEILLQYREEKTPVVKLPYLRWRWKKITHPPLIVRELSDKPTYGLELYKKISQSKIVFNAGVDFSKQFKVNMRNFEVLGCGAHLLSDEGIYPQNFEIGKHFSTYTDMTDFVKKVNTLLKEDERRVEIANSGHQMVKQSFSKEEQWHHFKKIVSEL